MKSGIYAIVNKINDKRYYGSSKNIPSRWYKHKHNLRNNIHQNPHLQNAWNKYGEAAFEFVVILNCEIDELMKEEQKYLINNKGGYNIGIDPKAAMRGKTLSKETKAKIGAAQLGKKRSAEQKTRMKQAQQTLVASRPDLREQINRTKVARGKGYAKNGANSWIVRFKWQNTQRSYGSYPTESEAKNRAEQVKRELGIL